MTGILHPARIRLGPWRLADGPLLDIRDWSLGSAGYRGQQPAAPADWSSAKHVERPSGDKDVRAEWEPHGDR